MSGKALRLQPQKWYGKVMGPLMLAFGIFYLTFHALSGERGIYALLKEERKLTVLNAELVKVTAERRELEHRVRLLNTSSLDTDLLDEQARNVLGMAAEDELVIPLASLDASPAQSKE